MGLKLALVSEHPKDFSLENTNILMGDFWGLFYWIQIYHGDHISYTTAIENPTVLNKYDAVMISGNDRLFDKVEQIVDSYKGISIFFPEGDISLYHDCGVSPQFYRILDKFSIVGVVEEDKVPYYRLVTKKHVAFLHVPVPDKLIDGFFFGKFEQKNGDILIYGDNNPNNPSVAVVVARKLEKPIAMTEISQESVDFIKNYMKVQVSRYSKKLDQFEYLSEWMKLSKVCIYPTRWIGTSRQMISGAVCGTPVVGSRDSHTQQRLWPSLAIKNYDVNSICEVVTQLYEDKDFYQRVVDYAFREVKFYSVANARERLENAIRQVN